MALPQRARHVGVQWVPVFRGTAEHAEGRCLQVQPGGERGLLVEGRPRSPCLEGRSWADGTRPGERRPLGGRGGEGRAVPLALSPPLRSARVLSERKAPMKWLYFG